MEEDSEGDWQVLTVKNKLLKSDMKHKTRIYCADFVNAVHNCDRRSQFCERRSQFSIVNVGATPRRWAMFSNPLLRQI
jgi:hypothetical protein